MSEYMLEALNITKRFPGVLANNNVCLNVKPGEILGLIGENGAGKSTILKVLNGIYPTGTYEGKIIVDGEEVSFENSNDAIKKGIGFVPQEINVLKYFTVAENIYLSDLDLENAVGYELPADYKTRKKNPFLDKKALNEAARKLLVNSGIDLDPDADVRKLSIGKQQLLMIARALASHPKVLILDEPTTSLSNQDVDKLFEVVRALRDKGTAVIFVTHKMAEILELTDRVTILRDGENISTFERANYDSGKIIADMIGREISNMYPSRTNEVGDVVFEAKGVTVPHPYIADVNQVQDISFKVRAGEVLGFAGLVGAGRSEVMQAIFGVTKMSKGELFLNGEKITIKDTSDGAKKGIGFVSEDRKKYGLNFVWDIKNNITISNLNVVSKGFVVQDNKLASRAKTYFDELRVKAPTLETMVGNLSGGNQQKVVIARSLNTDPKVLILDEPTKGIDVGSKNEIYQLINDLCAKGVAVIMISSELPELMAMSDRVMVMAEGRIVGELQKDEIENNRIMEMATTTFKKGGKA